ncbi:MAG: RHS repeat-associated core domain-containing protein, partial [Kiritimatiellae bacterium]|nr:RHS repeat-associated core domain-containing protein [Kiritimatiellia bacterium]
DAAGNRMTRTEDGDTVTYALGVGDRLASWTGGAYTHDIAGNVTRIERDGRPTLDLTWNSQYQLVSVSTNGVFAESYTYDALNRRASTTTLEGTTRHIYDNNWQVIADIDEQGSVIASYTWGEGIDNLLAVTIGGATYYPLTDVQGTIWGYVDSQNNVVARWQYDAWGNVLSEDISPSAAALATLRYRFQGREWSAATGLINFRMRWYDAETGRWLSKDPIGLSGGLNLYAFCGNSPIAYLDPLGKNWWSDNVVNPID